MLFLSCICQRMAFFGMEKGNSRVKEDMQTTNRFGPPNTPRPIKLLLLITGITALASALIHVFFGIALGAFNPQWLLSLSSVGVSHFLLWQPLSYIFVHNVAGGITFAFFLYLLFNLYILWAMGSALTQQIGTRAFVRFYLATALLIGLAILGVQFWLGVRFPYAGATPLIFSLLVLWSMFFPETEILLFMTFPVKSKWLIFGFLTIYLFVSLVQGDWLTLAAYSSGALCAYLYGTVGHHLTTPFPWTYSLDRRLHRIGERLQYGRSPSVDSKIFDFKTGKAVVDDEAFMDAMLSKISEKGESSLSWFEKRRMRKISQQRQKEE